MIKGSRWLGLFLALSLIFGFAAPLGQPATASGLKIDSLLNQKLATLPLGASLDAILTYDHKPTVADVAAAPQCWFYARMAHRLLPAITC